MADILAAFDTLEKEEAKKNPKKAPKSTATKFRNPLTSSNNKSSNSKSANTSPTDTRQGRSARPRSLPPQSRPQSTSPTNNNHLGPSYSGGDYAHSARSPSVASGRRISFVEAPRPPSTQHRLRILTNKESLLSGFHFDPKLNKYSVTQTEWKDFCNGVVERCELSRSASWAWKLHKNDAIKKVKRDMQYEGSDLKRYFNAWNRNFRRKGFTVSIEVPGPPKIREMDSEEEKEQSRKEAKFFRMVVTPNAEKAGSIYSRTSSLTRGVSMEGLSLQPSNNTQDEDVGGEDDQAQAEEAEAAQAEVKEALEEREEVRVVK